MASPSKVTSLMRKYGSNNKTSTNAANKHNYAAKAALMKQAEPRPSSPNLMTAARVKSRSFAGKYTSATCKPEA